MKQIKIRIKSPGHSEMVQEKLFEMGYAWYGEPIDKKVKHVNERYLFVGTYAENRITYACSADDDYFESQPHIEFELVEVISYEFKEIPKRNVVKVGENSYYEDELAEALKNIKPISTDYKHDN